MGSREEWTAVGDQLSALCLKLKLHAEEELSDDDLREKSGFERLGAVIDETFEAIGNAYEDEAVRDDAREAGRALGRALDATVREVQERLRGSTA